MDKFSGFLLIGLLATLLVVAGIFIAVAAFRCFESKSEKNLGNAAKVTIFEIIATSLAFQTLPFLVTFCKLKDLFFFETVTLAAIIAGTVFYCAQKEKYRISRNNRVETGKK